MMTLARRSRWSVLAIWILLVVCIVTDAKAQPPGGSSVNVFVPADRTLRQHLVRASKAIQEERFSDAVAELGFILASPPPDGAAAAVEGNREPQDFFLDVTPQSGARTSLKSEAQRLLGTLPPKGRELYELQFGAIAKAMLEEAIQESNLDKLHEVMRRYFHTKAGGEATLLLGRLYLDSGRPLAAALYLQQLAELPNIASDFEPELSVLLAAGWYQAHQPAKAQEVLQHLFTRHPRTRLNIGGMEVESLPPSNQVLAWLEQHFGAPKGGTDQRSQWALFRGNESRNAASHGGVPLKGFRWRIPVAGFDQDQRLIEEIQQNYIEQGVALLPGLQPLAVDNVVLMRTPEHLMAVDFDSGKRVWNYPWWDLPQESQADETAGFSPAVDREWRKQNLTQRLWQDAPYGQISSDGELVYLLDSQRHVASMNVRPLRMMQMRGGLMPFGNTDGNQVHNQLVALELKREGALKWKVGGETGWEEPQLAGAFFLGPPLPLFGNLYVLVEMRGEIRLVVLDADTGRQQWSQQLAHLEPIWGLDPMMLRRLVGATPSFANGVLVCPTSSGAVVSVDIAARRLLWGFQYTQNLAHSNQFGLPYSGSFPSASGKWLDATATLADGSVVLTPPESDLLICLDLLTGQPRWKPLSRQGDLTDMLYVACIHEGKIVLVGKQRVMAVNLANGQSAWDEPLVLDQSKGEMPSGRGFLANGHYFLPTTASQLAKIELATGKIVERADTEGVLGNLICFRDDIVSLSSDRVTTSYQLEPLRKSVAERLGKDPRDAWALARRGELLLHEGRPTEALAALQQANEIEPNDEAVRSLLVETFLTALRKDFARHQVQAEKIESLIENESQRIDYLVMLGMGSQQAGDVERATEAYLKLAQIGFATIGLSEANPFPSVTPADGWTVRLDHFVQARLTDLYALGQEPIRKRIDEVVTQHLAGIDKVDEPQAARLLELCGFHPAVGEYRLDRAAKLIDAGRILDAEWLLAAAEKSPQDEHLARVAALRIKLYVMMGDVPRLAPLYEQARKRWPDTVLLEDKTGQQIYDDAVSKGLVVAHRDQWPAGKVQVDESRDAFNRQGFRRIFSFPIVQPADAEPRDLRLIFDTGTSAAYVRGSDGEIVARLPQLGNSGPYQQGMSVIRAVARDHVLLLSLGDNVLAVPMLRERAGADTSILWRETLLPLSPEATSQIKHRSHNIPIPFDSQPREIANFEDATSNKPVAVTGPMNRQGVCFQKVRTLTCVDPLSGKVVWSRTDLDQGQDLFGDEQFVFAWPRGTQEAILLDAADGRELGRRAVPDADHVWATHGRNLLAWEEKDTDLRLYLRDVERQQDHWSETVPAATRACLVDSHHVAILRPDGQFTLRSLDSDRQVIEGKIQLTQQPESIRVRLSRQQCLLIVNDNTPLPSELQANNLGTSFPTQVVNGQIYAFDRTTGQSLWPTPATVRGYSLPVEQPDDLPTLWLVRQYRRGQFGGQTVATDVICLDRRTGAMVLERRTVPTQLSSFQVTANVAKREINLSLPQITYSLKFTDEPLPPEPAAQLAQAGTMFEAAVQGFADAIEPIKGMLGIPGLTR